MTSGHKLNRTMYDVLGDSRGRHITQTGANRGAEQETINLSTLMNKP